MSKIHVFTQLQTRGIVRVDCDFSGGGDEGGVEYISATMSDGTKKAIADEYGYKASDTEYIEDFPKDVVQELCQPVYDKYYSFAGEFYVSGRLIWDVKNRTVKMEGSESVPTDVPFEDEL